VIENRVGRNIRTKNRLQGQNGGENFRWRRMRWTEHVARIEEKMNTYRLLVGKLERDH
jgi:hypothetical protein